MLKMGLYDSFECLQHKLWSKEGSGIKVLIWFPTIKSLKSSLITCVQMAHHILLEKFQQGI
jgi:hypothetical protein